VATQAESSTGTLDREALGLTGVLFQGITHIGPALFIFALVPVVNHAGSAAALCFLLAMLLMVPIANTVTEFSRYVPASGGYYTYTCLGLGRRWGFMTAWAFIVDDPPGLAAVCGFLGYLGNQIFASSLGWNIPWWVFSLTAIGIVWFIAYRGIGISARAMTILGGLELLIMIALTITFFANPAPGSSLGATFSIHSAPNGLSGIIYGVLFAFLSVSGWESIAPLAGETRNSTTFVSRAVFGSLFLVGLYEMAIAAATNLAWGTGPAATQLLIANANPFYALAKHLWGPAWVLVFFAIVNSVLGNGVAIFSGSSRVLYSMGKAGTLPRALAHINPRFRTPSTAIHAIGIVNVVLVLVIGKWVGSQNLFGFIGTIITLALILVYIAGNLALVRYMLTQQRQDFNVLKHMIAPVVGSLLLLPVIYVTFWPLPPYPYIVAPYFVIGWLVLGYLVMLWIDKKDPEALQRGGDYLEMPTMSPMAAEGGEFATHGHDHDHPHQHPHTDDQEAAE
jgi:amino acid transporter